MRLEGRPPTGSMNGLQKLDWFARRSLAGLQASCITSTPFTRWSCMGVGKGKGIRQRKFKGGGTVRRTTCTVVNA